MQSSPSQSEASLHAVDYWQVIKNRWGIILITLFLVFMTAATITYLLPRKYESSASIVIKQRGQVLTPFGENFSQGSGANRMTPRFMETEFEIIRSSKSLGLVAEKLNLMKEWGFDKDTVVEILKNKVVTAQPIRGTDMISIKARHEDKQIARDIAAEVALAYRDYRRGLEEGESDRAMVELAKAVRDQEDKVEERRKALANIVQEKGIIYSGAQSIFGNPGVENDDSARNAADAYSKIEQQKIELESQIKSLLKYNSDQLMVYASGLDLPENIVKTLYPQYLSAQNDLDAAKTQGLGDRHPTVLELSGRVANMKKQLDEGVVNLRDVLRARLDMATAQLAQVEVLKDEKKEEAINRGISTQDYVDAKREFETDLELLQTMKLKYVTEKVSKTMNSDSIEIHEEPTIGQQPVTPKVKLMLSLGAIIGLIFGVGIAFFLEYLDTSVKSLEDVERYLQVPVLAVIPKDVGVLHKQNGMSPDAEAYRILRTNIEFNRKNPEDNSITVVSGGAGEGKSTTLVNLAYICAQGGYTTLMIDGDLRRPRLHTFFDINNSVGLSNYLTTDMALEDVILQTPVDNLYFMPSGILPSDAAGILNSRRMSELIQDVKQRFDLVLIDSPPILGVSDASVLASEVDLTMIVVQHRKLPRNMLIRVKQAVENVGGHVIGVVLNNVDVRSDSQYQYYTSYYTYYAPTEPQATAAAGNAPARPRPAASSEGKGGDAELY